MDRKRRVLGATLKAQVVLAAVQGNRTIAQWASEFNLHPSRVTAR
jgi:transposase-like protein